MPGQVNGNVQCEVHSKRPAHRRTATPLKMRWRRLVSACICDHVSGVAWRGAGRVGRDRPGGGRVWTGIALSGVSSDE